VKYAREKLGVDPDHAEKIVAEVNKHREQYVMRHWSRQWLSPANYHICLDTSWFGIDRAADLVVEIARARLEGGR
jgi:hypothetical protein